VDYSTCLRTRPIDHGPIGGPSEGVEAFSGFVSNDRNNKTRNPAAMCKPAQLPDRCGIGSWRENQIVKLKRGSDPSTGLGEDNRMYYGPSAQRQIRFYFRVEIM